MAKKRRIVYLNSAIAGMKGIGQLKQAYDIWRQIGVGEHGFTSGLSFTEKEVSCKTWQNCTPSNYDDDPEYYKRQNNRVITFIRETVNSFKVLRISEFVNGEHTVKICKSDNTHAIRNTKRLLAGGSGMISKAACNKHTFDLQQLDLGEELFNMVLEKLPNYIPERDRVRTALSAGNNITITNGAISVVSTILNDIYSFFNTRIDSVEDGVINNATYSAATYYLKTNPEAYYNSILNFTGTLTNTKTCIYTTGTGIVCDTTLTTGTVTGVSGTSPIVSSGGTTPTISATIAKDLVTTAPLTGAVDNVFLGTDSDITIAIPKATSSVDGYLDNSDWTTFNNKGSGTVTSVTGTTPIVSSEGTTPAISITMEGDLVTTAPITGGALNIFPGTGTKSTIAIPKSTSAVDGYLDNADWTTFNNKADSDTTYSAGNGISLSTTTFSVAGGTALTQDADGLSVTADAIGDTQLQFNTGQALTTTSNPTFDGTIVNEINMSSCSITYNATPCIITRCGTTQSFVCP